MTAGPDAAGARGPALRGAPVLVLVTDRRRARRPLAEAVSRALAGGVTAVVLREKDLSTSDLVALGGPVRDACRAAGATFLVNRDVEAAVALAADGVHLGFDAPPVVEARASLAAAGLPRGGIVGRSVHDAAELARARGVSDRDGADYVTFGPVWDTPSKRGLLEPRGVGALAAAVRSAPGLQVLALGGVTAERAAEVRLAGAAGIAAIGALLDTSDERAAAAAVVRAWRDRR